MSVGAPGTRYPKTRTCSTSGCGVGCHTGVVATWDELSAADRALLADAPVARLGTVRAGGTPHLVPITFALCGELLVTAVDAKPKRTRDLQRLRNIEAQPAVTVLVDAYHDDWSALWWVRVDGVAEVIDDGPAWTRAVDALVAKYAQYRGAVPTGPVILVRAERVVSWHANA